MIKQFLSTTKNIWMSLRNINKNKPKLPKITIYNRFKNFVKTISHRHIARIIFLAPILGIGSALFCYNIRNYTLMNVILISFTAPQLIFTLLIILFVLLIPTLFLNKRLTLLGDGVCFKIEKLSQKVNLQRLFYISLFAGLLFDSYMTTIFLLEPVKSYAPLYVFIIQFSFLQPYLTLMFNLYVHMLVEFIQVVTIKIDTKIHDEDIDDAHGSCEISV